MSKSIAAICHLLELIVAAVFYLVVFGVGIVVAVAMIAGTLLLVAGGLFFEWVGGLWDRWRWWRGGVG